MNEEQLNVAIEKFTILQSGLSNKEIKALGLRPFCYRIQRRVKGTKKVASLYTLTPEWTEYVKREIAKNEHATGIQDFLQELSIPNSYSSLISTSSIEPIGKKKNSISDEIYDAIVYGNCHLVNIFDRVMLLQSYFDKLCNDGMSSISIIQHDLYGMLGDYLIKTNKGLYRLKDNVQLHIQNIIYQYYKRDINEYLDFVKEIWSKWRYAVIVGNPNIHILEHVKKSLPLLHTKVIETLNSIEYSEISKSLIELFIDKYHKENNEFFDELIRGKIEANVFIDDIEKLFKSLKSSVSIELFNVREEWEHLLSPRRDELICELIRSSYKKAKSYSERIHHPFILELNVLICLYYIIIKEDELGRYEISITENETQTITSDTIFQLISTVGSDEISRLVSLYLLKRQVDASKETL